MSRIVWQFASDNSIGGLAIRYGTRCDWCHVDAVLPDDGGLLGARIKGGVQIRPAGYKKFIATQRMAIETDCADAFYSHLHTQIGKPYDWRAIIAFGLGDRDWREDDSWFCSELQIWAAEQAGFFPHALNIPTDRLSPRDHWLLFSAWGELIP